MFITKELKMASVAEKVVKLTKYLEQMQNQATKETNVNKKTFFTREVKKTETKLSSLTGK